MNGILFNVNTGKPRRFSSLIGFSLIDSQPLQTIRNFQFSFVVWKPGNFLEGSGEYQMTNRSTSRFLCKSGATNQKLDRVFHRGVLKGKCSLYKSSIQRLARLTGVRLNGSLTVN